MSWEDVKDYDDYEDFDGMCALIYAICNPECKTIQQALDKFGITPYIDVELLRSAFINLRALFITLLKSNVIRNTLTGNGLPIKIPNLLKR